MRKLTSLITALALALSGLVLAYPAEAVEPVTVISASTSAVGDLTVIVEAKTKTAITSTLAGEKAAFAKKFAKWQAKVSGRYINLDGMYGAQCVDLANAYVRYFTAIKAWVFGNAAQWLTRTDSRVAARYDTLPASTTPQKGDILVQKGGAANAVAGHIAVVAKDGTKTKFFWGKKRSMVLVVQQNAPTVGDASNTSWWPTWGVIGYLRPVQLVAKTKTTSTTTLKKLAARYKVTVAQLKELNPSLAKKARIAKGTSVTIRPAK